MGNLIKTEWLKLRNYKAFWWMAIIVTLSYPGINYIFYQFYKEAIEQGGEETKRMVEFLMGNPFTFPEVWHTVAFASSIFIFIPALVVIMFITNEYTYKTHRQNVIDGWSRNQFMTSKMIDVLIISLITSVIYLLVAISIGFVNIEESDGNAWAKSQYIFYFFLQTFSQLSLAFLIAFLVRKAFISLGIFLFYKIILEKIMVAYAAFKLDDVGRFLPFEISNRIIPYPPFIGRFDKDGYDRVLSQVNQHVVFTVLLIILTWFICYRINKKRDL